MRFKLDCSTKYHKQIETTFNEANIEINQHAELMIIDNPQYVFSYEDPLQDFKSIEFIEAFGNDIHIHYSNKKHHKVTKETLYQLEEQFKDHGFIRVNKSQLVNIRFIDDIEPYIGQKLILTMKSSTIIDVNRTYYKKFKAYLNI